MNASIRACATTIILIAAAATAIAAPPTSTPLDTTVPFAQAPDQVTHEFNLPEQPLADSLRRIGQITTTNILFDPAAVRDRRAQAVNGILTTSAAIEMAVRDLGLEVTQSADVVVVRKAGQKSAAENSKDPNISSARDPKSSEALTLAQAERSEGPTGAEGADQKQSLAKGREGDLSGVERVDEVVVTGSHIRQRESLSPLTTITSDDMRQQGYTRLDQVFEQLPQNFKAGVSALSNQNNNAGQGAQYNYGFASGVNLRGLGPNATLILLNGHRLAPTALGSTTDISSISVSVIDRIEILADGASAMYGSDAVAGVVNIITKSDYQGFETGVRANSVTEGKSPNYGAHLLGGLRSENGGFVINYDYQKDRPLFAASRDFASDAVAPTTLLPDQEASSVYASLDHQFTPQLGLSTHALFSDRKYHSDNLIPGFSLTGIVGRGKQLSLNGQLDYAFSTDWTATLIGQYSRQNDENDVAYIDFDASVGADYQYDVRSVESRVEGPLYPLATGTVRGAAGVSNRRESFENAVDNFFAGSLISETGLRQSRQVNSAYAEVLIPLVGGSKARTFMREVMLDIAARYDDYSDFGTTTNPKFSLKWSPTESLAFHANYSKGFRAPELYILNPTSLNVAYVADMPDPSSTTGVTRVLILDGTNPDLDAERAVTRSVGFDLGMPQVPAFNLNMSYFDIKYDNRIKHLIDERYFLDVFTREAELGHLVNRNPTAGQIVSELQDPERTIVNLVGAFSPDSIEAIANIGYVNAASSRQRGIDMAVRHFVQMASGRVSADLSTSYLLHFRTKNLPAAAETDAIGAIYNPPRLRTKLNVGFERAYWSANVRLNYSSGSTNFFDTTCSPEGCDVASWTTVDLALSYSGFAAAGGILQGVRASLSLVNALGRDPPLARIPGGVNFDPVNSDPLGRAVAVTASKSW